MKFEIQIQNVVTALSNKYHCLQGLQTSSLLYLCYLLYCTVHITNI